MARCVLCVTEIHAAACCAEVRAVPATGYVNDVALTIDLGIHGAEQLVITIVLNIRGFSPMIGSLEGCGG